MNSASADGDGAAKAKSLATLPLELLRFSQPYMSDRFPLFWLYDSFPFTRCSIGPRDGPLEDVLLCCPSEDELAIERLYPDIEQRTAASFSFSRSLIAWGTPSHFELTFGTVGGNFADDTPGIPTGTTLPFFDAPFFIICFW